MEISVYFAVKRMARHMEISMYLLIKNVWCIETDDVTCGTKSTASREVLDTSFTVKGLIFSVTRKRLSFCFNFVVEPVNLLNL